MRDLPGPAAAPSGDHQHRNRSGFLDVAIDDADGNNDWEIVPDKDSEEAFEAICTSSGDDDDDDPKNKTPRIGMWARFYLIPLRRLLVARSCAPR